jgi:4-hydroxyacetophenone monooxygenase
LLRWSNRRVGTTRLVWSRSSDLDVRLELLTASDEAIEGAVKFADSMVLRSLFYQLTGDESIGSTSVATAAAGYFEFKSFADPIDVALPQSRAADFLKASRDGGAGDVDSGPADRLQRSLGFRAGEDIRDSEIEM